MLPCGREFKSVLLNYFRQVNPDTSKFGQCGIFSADLQRVSRHAEVRKVGVQIVSKELEAALAKRYFAPPDRVTVKSGMVRLQYECSKPGVMIVSNEVAQREREVSSTVAYGNLEQIRATVELTRQPRTNP
jgi:hypothetical protein